MLKELQDLGLSEKEVAVYLASLELGPATAQQLAKHSKILRSTTYVQIESLMKKGLMSTYEQDKKTLFAPESPAGLKRLLQEQQRAVEAKAEDLNTLLPNLIRMFESAGERPVVRFFEGKEGIESVREEALQVKSKELLVIYSYEKFREIFSKEELASYSKRRIESKIQSRIIYTHVEEPEPNYSPLPLAEVQFLSPEVLNVKSDVLIYDNRVAFIVLDKTLHSVVIESNSIAATMRGIFEYFWMLGKKEIFREK